MATASAVHILAWVSFLGLAGDAVEWGLGRSRWNQLRHVACQSSFLPFGSDSDQLCIRRDEAMALVRDMPAVKASSSQSVGQVQSAGRRVACDRPSFFSSLLSSFLEELSSTRVSWLLTFAGVCKRWLTLASFFSFHLCQRSRPFSLRISACASMISMTPATCSRLRPSADNWRTRSALTGSMPLALAQERERFL
jgi:hypothetical protein